MRYSKNICFFAFAVMLAAVPLTANAEYELKDGKKGLNAVNVKVVVTEPDVTLTQLENIALAFFQWYVPVEIDPAWIGLGDSIVSDKSEEGETTKRRPRFKAGSDLSSSVN